jgi:hypothetical protein
MENNLIHLNRGFNPRNENKTVLSTWFGLLNVQMWDQPIRRNSGENLFQYSKAKNVRQLKVVMISKDFCHYKNFDFVVFVSLLS